MSSNTVETSSLARFARESGPAPLLRLSCHQKRTNEPEVWTADRHDKLSPAVSHASPTHISPFSRIPSIRPISRSNLFTLSSPSPRVDKCNVDGAALVGVPSGFLVDKLNSLFNFHSLSQYFKKKFTESRAVSWSFTIEQNFMDKFKIDRIYRFIKNFNLELGYKDMLC